LFDTEAKIIKRMTPLLQRVLIVDPQPVSARFIGDLMRNLVGSQVVVAESVAKAIRACGSYNPSIIFVEFGSTIDGAEFTRQLRRSHLGCRYAPVVMLTNQATAGGILAARDAGVHEFLRKPFTMKDLLRRLEAVTLRRRDWVEAVGYVGPDRRRFNSGDYTGPLKRQSDAATPDTARMIQALKILRSSIMAVDIDPAQAMRSMRVQAADLQKCGVAIGDAKLAAAASDLERYLGEIDAKGPPYSSEQLQISATALLAYMPKDEEAFAA